MQYTKIDRRREHRVVDSHIILIHRIFESAEVRIVILQEVLEEWECISAWYWQEKWETRSIIVLTSLIDISRITRLPRPRWDMSLIEIPIFTIVVPLPSYWLAIILDQDIARSTHIPIKILHNWRLLKLFAKFYRSDHELSVLEYLKWYSLEYISIDLASKILLRWSHRYDICDTWFLGKFFYTLTIAPSFYPVSPISEILTLI